MTTSSFYPVTLFLLALPLLLALGCSSEASESRDSAGAETQAVPPAYAMVIHGGAGTIRRENMSEEMEAEYRAAMEQALTIGEDILKAGGSSLDAVTQTIIFLENDPHFNAGRGAVFTHEGKNELDASIMHGARLEAGAVGGVTTVKNPITLARAVMEKSPHVMLTGAGAEQYAKEVGLELTDPEWFYTERRWRSLQNAKARENQESFLDHDPRVDSKFGTVGCVALDSEGNIVAGTSTGGMTNKRYNRIGDSPVIGAGTYADNTTCGVSCTGHGEYFIRYAVAYDMSALMAYKGLSVEEAGREIIDQKLLEAGGSGGLIALDRMGNIAMPFNTEGMYRGYVKPGERYIGIYGDE